MLWFLFKIQIMLGIWPTNTYKYIVLSYNAHLIGSTDYLLKFHIFVDSWTLIVLKVLSSNLMTCAYFLSHWFNMRSAISVKCYAWKQQQSANLSSSRFTWLRQILTIISLESLWNTVEERRSKVKCTESDGRDKIISRFVPCIRWPIIKIPYWVCHLYALFLATSCCDFSSWECVSTTFNICMRILTLS